MTTKGTGKSKGKGKSKGAGNKRSKSKGAGRRKAVEVARSGASPGSAAGPPRAARSASGSRRAARASKAHAAPRSQSVPGDGKPRRVAMAVAEEGLDKKAQNVEIIDVRDKVDYADYVVVMSGRSDRQVNAIAKGVEQGLQEKGVARCLGVEGLPQGNWVLMDFGDVVVHVFHKDTRGYYDLESLWIDAARVSVAEG